MKQNKGTKISLDYSEEESMKKLHSLFAELKMEIAKVQRGIIRMTPYAKSTVQVLAKCIERIGLEEEIIGNLIK